MQGIGGIIIDNYNLARFIEAQHLSYETALGEIRNGRKGG
ncbi:MAG: DUF1810 domain-containing protein [Bacteroidales bacterium]|nr:DUF1810 domain-containing protein [Bacteroidales bacterium]